MKIIIGTVILVALGWITWPYYAVYDFANALDQGDQVALEHRVDWDSVRRGLRDDLNAVFLEGLSKNDLATSPLSTGLTALLGPTIINNVIDSYVTPRGIANLIRSGRPSIPNAAQTENSIADQSSASRLRLHWEQVRYAFFSGGPLTLGSTSLLIKPNQGNGLSRAMLRAWTALGFRRLSRGGRADASAGDKPAKRDSAHGDRNSAGLC